MLVTSPVFAADRALIIGLNNYKYYAPLSYSQNDADDMKEFLRRAGFEPDKIWLVKDDIDIVMASELDKCVRAFARSVQEGDRVLFYFSGHGTAGHDRNNYLMGYDGSRETPERFSISLTDVRLKLKETGPSESVLIRLLRKKKAWLMPCFFFQNYGVD